MARKPTSDSPYDGAARVDTAADGDATVVSISGLLDEHFPGFGQLANVKALAIDVRGMTRMTSFGVRQWLKGIEALPKSITALYLVNCPTFFVDQLNMVLNFGGAASVLSVVAPFMCTGCGAESGETIDVLADRAMLVKGGVPEKWCATCGSKLELDETPESYFAFMSKYAASSLEPSAARLLSSLGLYTSSGDTPADKPPRIIKLVRGSVTYFRIVGAIGSTFRARPFLVGAEGEIVIDLADLDRFEIAGQREWRRLLKSLSAQVTAITLVDVGEAVLASAGDSFSVAKNVAVWSVLAPYRCLECGHASRRSSPLSPGVWPPRFADHVCSSCGGVTRSQLAESALAPLHGVTSPVAAASAKLIEQRDEVLSRALADANAAQAGAGAGESFAAGSTILGKYEIVRPLSAGGMAEVFLAKQVGIGGFEKPVALKRIQRQLLESRHMAIDMFLNEAKIAGRLAHPNIVQVLDVGEVGGALYLAMEYVHGKDLRDVVKQLRATRARMPLGLACLIVREIAKALHHAYWSNDINKKQLAVVHRDVSPHNVILGYDGAVKLIDFGVAMSAVTEQAGSMIVGKWQYMSPEHTTNQQLDHRSDLFSLGVILYLLCTGAMPFTGTDPREIVRKVRAGQYKPLRMRDPSLPIELEQVVARMLAPDPSERPQTGREVVTMLTEIEHSRGLTAPPLAHYLGELYGEEVKRAVELVLRPHSMSVNSLAMNSGPTEVDRSVPITPLSPSSSSHSLPDSASIPAAAVDASVSLVWRKPGKPASPPRTETWKTIVVAMLFVLVAGIVGYLILRPA